jgi:hypothetical protein
VVLYAFNHDGSLTVKVGNHHSSRKANAWMRNIATARNLVARIDNANVASLSQ